MVQLRGSPNGQAAAAGRQASRESEREEVRLVRRVAAGELRAFEDLYRIYYPRLVRFLGRLLRRPALTEEVLDDTMLVVWHRADSYNGASKVSTWIFAIAYRKGLKAFQRLDEPVDDEPAKAMADSSAGPEQQAGLGQLRNVLGKAIDGLSAEHRAVVELTYFHGLSYRDIADIVGCPVDTVKTRMFHARRRLRGLLAGELEDWL